ncbi:glycosyltransferase family 2 protein [Chitinimonas sp.]|uniref:glycosyltransferase n=1 Tax=Chitinimonas sp. TaxID=1934313 RepID=UPI0035B33A8B
MRIGVLLPTRNAGAQWRRCLEGLRRQTQHVHRVLVIDSSSTDDTRAIAEAFGCEVIVIDQADFDHGGTRQLGVTALADCDIVICITQDAILDDPTSLAKLCSAFADVDVGAAWGAQQPHADATPLAKHARSFNYSTASRVVTYADRVHLGLKCAFASNSYCAWRTSALARIGGFEPATLFGEDMLAAAKLLRDGWKIAYQADALIFHSHNYSALQEFKRYFDIGSFHQTESWLIREFGNIGGEGMRFIRSEHQFLAGHGIIWHAKAILHTAAKFAGYRLGLLSAHLPTTLCTMLSMNPGWWAHLNKRHRAE